ncbi:MAG: hypothetical protein QXU40_00270 [Candidatus Pacearchaeota archaeon]
MARLLEIICRKNQHNIEKFMKSLEGTIEGEEVLILYPVIKYDKKKFLNFERGDHSSLIDFLLNKREDYCGEEGEKRILLDIVKDINNQLYVLVPYDNLKKALHYLSDFSLKLDYKRAVPIITYKRPGFNLGYIERKRYENLNLNGIAPYTLIKNGIYYFIDVPKKRQGIPKDYLNNIKNKHKIED